MLSSTTIKELRRELKRLKHQRDLIEKKITAVNALLLSDEVHATVVSVGRPIGNVDTFAFKVRVALMGLGRNSTVKEVTKVLEAQGVKTSGKSPLSALVGSELHRAAKLGRTGIVKRGYGLYGKVSKKRASRPG